MYKEVFFKADKKGKKINKEEDDEGAPNIDKLSLIESKEHLAELPEEISPYELSV